MTRCGAGSDKSTCSPTWRTGGTRSPSCSTATNYDRGDAALRQLDEPVGDDVRAPTDRIQGRLSRPHLHARSRAAVRRPSDARDASRVANLGWPGASRRCRPAGARGPAITIRTSGDRLAFATPPLVRSGPVDEAFVERIASVCASAETTSSPPNGSTTIRWVAVTSRTPTPCWRSSPLRSTSIRRWSGRTHRDHPMRSSPWFFPKDGVTVEDPVTGSLNASLAELAARIRSVAGAVHRGPAGHGPRARRGARDP